MESNSAGRTLDEEVPRYVAFARAGRSSAEDDASAAPVVDGVVDVLYLAIELVVARSVVAVEVAVEGDVVRLHEAACRVRHESLSEDAVL